jgi:Domain of unknown function (DUF6542)
VTADHRSMLRNVPGVPWWAAVVVAVTATAVGFAFDAGSGNKQLTSVFSALYVLGCVAAVLAVRQSGVFTAVIQPPLILFCSVPGAYWLFHGAKLTGLRDLLINCGYPLIERFPLMLFTSAAVLLIGMIRWYLGMAARSSAPAKTEADAADSDRRTTGLAGWLASIFGRRSGADDTADKVAAGGSQRVHAVGRAAKSAKSAKPADRRRTAKRPAASRSRHVRPPLDDAPEPTVDRPRRRRPTHTREFDAAEPPRRGRLPRDPDLRGRPPQEIRRDPHGRKGRPTSRSSRFDPYEPMEPSEPFAPSEPRRRSVPNGTSGATATHHPISRVRYRGSARDEESYKDARGRSREPRKPTPDSWEYDV